MTLNQREEKADVMTPNPCMESQRMGATNYTVAKYSYMLYKLTLIKEELGGSKTEALTSGLI